MFTETTLRPPAWKIKALVIAGAVCAACAIGAAYKLSGAPLTGGRIDGAPAGLMFFFGAGMLFCWSQARTLASASLDIRKYGIEIKRRATEPLFIEWKEIERIETAVFNAPTGRGSGSTCHIGIRLVDKCSKRHAKEYEKNRLHSGCDILLAAIYGMSNEETVALLREKMREATGKPRPSPAEPMPDDLTAQPTISFDGLPCFECKCTSCMTVQTFCLEEPDRDGRDAGIKGAIRCPACKHTRRTKKDEEWEKLKQAARIWNQMQRGTLAKESAISEILALNSKIIGGIAFESRTWRCKGCGEENSPRFPECWNCQQTRNDTPENLPNTPPVDFEEEEQ